MRINTKYAILGILTFLLANIPINAQFNQDAPWMSEIKKTKSSNLTMMDQTEAFNTYWKTRDHTKKGSGYKPFMRWQEYWKNTLQTDGTIPPPKFLWDAWEQKQNMAAATTRKMAIPDWAPMGPFDHDKATSWSAGQGRVNVAIVDPNNANIFYAGAPAGGLWKSTDSGANWIPLTDHLPQIGVSGIAIDPNNSNIIYISTGDDDASDSYGIGVLKSTDAGLTWNKTGLEFTNTSTKGNDIYVDPLNSNTLWVATNIGVYKTINAGTTWTRTLIGDIKDIKLKPGNSNIVYATTRFAFYKSTNAGDTFVKVSTGLPTSSGRLAIDVTPAAPDYVYVLSAKTDNSFQGVYRSTDSGDSFTKRQETFNIFEGTQAWYDMALAVSDVDPNTVFVGVLNIWKSTNGGDSFTKVNRWDRPHEVTYTHADIHFLRYYNGRLFCGSDGGFYLSENDGGSFTDHTKGMQIGQFYRISVAENNDSHRLVGGLQDNGGYALRNSKWYNYFGADGMDCAVSGNNANTYHGFLQNGRFLYTTKDRGADRFIQTTGPELGNWVTPLVSNKNGILYAGYRHFYKIENNIFVKQSSFNFNSNISHIEIDPNNESIIYAAVSNLLYKSTDNGVNWGLAYTFPNVITSIEVHNNDSNIIYTTISGSTGGVFISSDQSTSFTNISSGLPSEAKLIVRHQKGSESIYVGTYLGVYHKNGDGPWENYSNGLPNVAVRDLEVNLKDKVLLAGTYGRGIWKVPLANASGNDNTQTAFKYQEIPGVIQAEDYDNGGQGIAYNDTTADNIGGKGRVNEGVDLENASDGSLNIGYVTAGEWIEYTVNLRSAGVYTADINYATNDINGGAIRLDFREVDKTGVIPLQKTPGWQSYVDKKSNRFQLSQGVQVMRVYVVSGTFNLNKIEIKPAVFNISETIEAELGFDINTSLIYDIVNTTGGKAVTTRFNFSIAYNVDIPTAGTYDFILKVASSEKEAAFGIRQGNSTLGNGTIPATGSNSNFQDLVIKNVNLTTSGIQTLRVTANNTGLNIDSFEIVPTETIAACSASATITGLSVTSDTNTTATVSFDPLSDVNKYEVRAFTDGTFNGSLAGAIAYSSGATSPITVTGLTAGTTYTFAIRALCSADGATPLASVNGTTSGESTTDLRPFFNKSKDILITQFDGKPDPDDIHSQAALGCMLNHKDFEGVNYYGVAGAIGKQGGRFIESGSLLDMALGAGNWTHAINDKEGSITRIANKVIPILQNGGRVWVQEAGNSNLTKLWVERVQQTVANNVVKNNVIVVQHSKWNYNLTDNTANELLPVNQQIIMNFIKANTSFYYINDGNFNFNDTSSGSVNGTNENGIWKTPSYRSISTSYLNQVQSNGNTKAKALWNEATRIIDAHGHKPSHSSITVGGIDYSDIVEDWWILNIGANADNNDKFWARYVTNDVVSEIPFDTKIGIQPVIADWVSTTEKFDYVSVRFNEGGLPKSNKIANATALRAIGEWESFVVEDGGNGNVRLKVKNFGAGYKYLVVAGTAVTATGTSATATEAQFTWETVGPVSAKQFGLKSVSTGKYLQIIQPQNGSVALNVNGGARGDWELFTYTDTNVNVLSITDRALNVSKEEVKIKINTNPITNGVLELRNATNASYTISNFAGQKVGSGNVSNNTIDTSNLKSGMYIIQFANKETFQTQIEKIVIQ